MRKISYSEYLKRIKAALQLLTVDGAPEDTDLLCVAVRDSIQRSQDEAAKTMTPVAQWLKEAIVAIGEQQAAEEQRGN